MQNVQSSQEEQQSDVTGQRIRRIRQLQTWQGQQHTFTQGWYETC